jgi:hypothetical protein
MFVLIPLWSIPPLYYEKILLINVYLFTILSSSLMVSLFRSEWRPRAFYHGWPHE